MKKQEFLEMVESLLDAVIDNCLSPEDFMARINELYDKKRQKKT